MAVFKMLLVQFRKTVLIWVVMVQALAAKHVQLVEECTVSEFSETNQVSLDALYGLWVLAGAAVAIACLAAFVQVYITNRNEPLKRDAVSTRWRAISDVFSRHPSQMSLASLSRRQSRRGTGRSVDRSRPCDPITIRGYSSGTIDSSRPGSVFSRNGSVSVNGHRTEVGGCQGGPGFGSGEQGSAMRNSWNSRLSGQLSASKALQPLHFSF
jgi:hypothetical protein